MKLLFASIQFDESAFFGRVADSLRAAGHEPHHVTISRRAAGRLSRRGQPARCLPELMGEVAVSDELAVEARQLERRYAMPSLRDVYLTDPACRGRSERWCIERTVRTFRALETVFDDVEPDLIVPEVGSETFRTAAWLIARARGIPVFFLFFTIFPEPLMIHTDPHLGPIVPEDELRELTDAEQQRLDRWVAEFTAAKRSILPHKVASVTPATLRDFARHVVVSLTVDRDNEYLRPRRFVVNTVVQRARAVTLRRLYEPVPADRPFVYFPLHVTDDFKVKRVTPHCVDQAYLIQQVADALPQGHDLVLKEHPFSIGRNPVGWLRRILRRPNIRLVDPYQSSHELIERAVGVSVIGSTVGLEALLYGQRVLTLGQPYYAGYGATVDVDSFREIREAVPAFLRFDPDPQTIARFLGAAMRTTYPGAPIGVDGSPDNAAAVASSIEKAIDTTLAAGGSRVG
ncbi:MAG: hypothetical protein ACR2NA_08900 [Solirubrobacterales bacterium]